MAQISIRINDDLLKEIQEFSENHEISKSEVLRFCIEQGFISLSHAARCNDNYNIKAIMSALFLSKDWIDIEQVLNN